MPEKQNVASVLLLNIFNLKGALTQFVTNCFLKCRILLTAWQTSHSCSNFILSMINRKAIYKPDAVAPSLKIRIICFKCKCELLRAKNEI